MFENYVGISHHLNRISSVTCEPRVVPFVTEVLRLLVREFIISITNKVLTYS